MKYHFRNDYSVLAHPRILSALAEYGDEENVAYGLDRHSLHAGELIKGIFGAKDAEIAFLAGGTQANLTFISYVLKPYEAVISLQSGHINVHETGAVEGTGHKIILVEGENGKMRPCDIDRAMTLHSDEHMVSPKMVYISDSTEIGTIYSRQELLDLRGACDRYGLCLFIDGARLGSALTSRANDVEPELLGKVADAFYVGGTKNGLLFGEALVLVNPALHHHFRHHIKNRGAMLAKGYAVGIQFEEAFRDGLYFDLARRTNAMADKLKEGFRKRKVDMGESPTNQIFATFEKENAQKLIDRYGCEKWEDLGEKWVIRFVTSFATEEADVQDVLKFIDRL